MNHLTKESVFEKLTAFQSRAVFTGIAFIVSNNPETNTIRIIGKSDADTIKATFPEFEIKQDVHKRRYAELVLHYE